jgi:hypothetical protein
MFANIKGIVIKIVCGNYRQQLVSARITKVKIKNKLLCGGGQLFSSAFL